MSNDKDDIEKIEAEDLNPGNTQFESISPEDIGDDSKDDKKDKETNIQGEPSNQQVSSESSVKAGEKTQDLITNIRTFISFVLAWVKNLDWAGYKARFISILNLEGIDRYLPKGLLDRLPEDKMKVTLPIFIMLVCFALLSLLSVFAPTVSKRTASVNLPVVEVMDAIKKDIRLPVYSRGVVVPSHEIQLVSVVSGPVEYVSPNLVEGGYVEEGQLLVKVSARRYEQDKQRVAARKAQAVSVQVAKKGELRVRGTLRTAAGKAQLKEVDAAVKAADADLQRVLDLIDQTEIKAPFSGLIRNVGVSTGQLLNAGTPIARIFETSSAEVSLPLSDRQLSLVNVPFFFLDKKETDSTSRLEKIIDAEANERVEGEQDKDNVVDNAEEKNSDLNAKNKELRDTKTNGDNDSGKGARVKFIGSFGDKNYEWTGRVVRSAGGRNEINRLQYLYTVVDDPYQSDPKQPDRPPLSPGTFVEAEIEGKLFNGIVELPRQTLRTNNIVWVVDESNRLVSRNVSILHRGKESVFISDGINHDDKIVISDMKVFLEGTEVKTLYQREESKSEKEAPESIEKSEANSKESISIPSEENKES